MQDETTMLPLADQLISFKVSDIRHKTIDFAEDDPKMNFDKAIKRLLKQIPIGSHFIRQKIPVGVQGFTVDRPPAILRCLKQWDTNYVSVHCRVDACYVEPVVQSR